MKKLLIRVGTRIIFMILAIMATLKISFKLGLVTFLFFFIIILPTECYFKNHEYCKINNFHNNYKIKKYKKYNKWKQV